MGYLWLHGHCSKTSSVFCPVAFNVRDGSSPETQVLNSDPPFHRKWLLFCFWFCSCPSKPQRVEWKMSQLLLFGAYGCLLKDRKWKLETKVLIQNSPFQRTTSFPRGSLQGTISSFLPFICRTCLECVGAEGDSGKQPQSWKGSESIPFSCS